MPRLLRMKMPAVFGQFFRSTPEKKKLFLSLFIDDLVVYAAAWHVKPSGQPEIEKTTSAPIERDSWDGRAQACDEAISDLEETVGTNTLHSVVLGLSSQYLAESGDIIPSFKPHLKALCKELMLQPIGFVSVHQALVHTLKAEEGVPPSVILLYVTKSSLTVSLYKIGTLVGQQTIEKKNAVVDLEGVLKSYRELEVLPSRMLLFGSDTEGIQQVQRELLQHPWPTRVNFLHFPKIEILPVEMPITAVSYAGASELATAIGIEDTEDESAQKNSHEDIDRSEKESSMEDREEQPEDVSDQEETPLPDDEDVANVTVVNPEALGFARGADILEMRETNHDQDDKNDVAETKQTPVRPKLSLPPIALPALPKLHIRMPSLPSLGILLPIIIFSSICIGIVGILYWFYPRAAITIFETPKTLEEHAVITINPTATIADASTKIIPGKKLEKTVNGQKTLPVVGKKSIGDPAKGSVTIYNKSLSSRTFKKGTVLVFDTLPFTLDDDVSVASASESIGSITFGKANASVTASVIGTKANLAAASEFSFKDISTSIAIARNDQPFNGGTSKEVTVVSRTDYDALVKSLTGELVEKAKAELAGSVGGSEKLIDATIKTAVVEKTFVEELDQESKELHGKLTLTVSGISYSEADAVTVMKGTVEPRIPEGYALAAEKTTTTVADIQVKKDGSMSAKVNFQSVALPRIDIETVKKSLAGKSLKAAENYLRTVVGVGAVEFGNLRTFLSKDHLPVNAKNISISLAIQE